MTENRAKLVAAATSQFARYGVKRTSMANVAQEAGLSRQTLYSMFPGKDELLAAAMSSFIDQLLMDLSEEWEKTDSITGILNAYYKHAVFKPFDILQKTPDLRDLLHGVGEHTNQLAKASETRKRKLLAAQLKPFSSQLKNNNSSPDAIAHFIVRTTTEFKYSTNNKKELEKLLRTLSQAVVSLVK